MSLISGNANMVRYVLLGFNLIFLITGIILLAVGVNVNSNFQYYSDFMPSDIYSVPAFLIVIGIFILIITIYGCWSALKESYHLQLIYTLLLIIIFVFELAAGISGYALSGNIKNDLKVSLTSNLKGYVQNAPDGVTNLWDTIQRDYDCCGVTNYKDWTTTFPTWGTNLPLSCCSIPNGVVGSFSCTATTGNVFLYPEGCLAKFSDNIAGHATTVGVWGILIAIVELVGVLFSAFFTRELKIRQGIAGFW